MVATFHLHYLGHRVKYENLEVGNTTQQLLSTTRSCCSIESIESFLFWVILVTYNIAYILVCIFIKLAIFILFLLCSTVMFFMHSMLNILRYEKIFYEIDELIASLHDPSSDAIFLGVHSECVFPFMEITFSSWITLTISLDELNSIDWLLNCWWWIFLK